MTEALSRAESTLTEMAELIASELTHLGIAQAGEVAGKVVVALAKSLGGCQFYLPKGAAMDRHLRDLEIRAAHDGTVDGKNGVLSLAKRHDLSELAIYRILSKGRITNVV